MFRNYFAFAFLIVSLGQVCATKNVDQDYIPQNSSFEPIRSVPRLLHEAIEQKDRAKLRMIFQRYRSHEECEFFVQSFRHVTEDPDLAIVFLEFLDVKELRSIDLNKALKQSELLIKIIENKAISKKIKGNYYTKGYYKKALLNQRALVWVTNYPEVLEKLCVDDVNSIFTFFAMSKSTTRKKFKLFNNFLVRPDFKSLLTKQTIDSVLKSFDDELAGDGNLRSKKNLQFICSQEDLKETFLSRARAKKLEYVCDEIENPTCNSERRKQKKSTLRSTEAIVHRKLAEKHEQEKRKVALHAEKSQKTVVVDHYLACAQPRLASHYIYNPKPINVSLVNFESLFKALENNDITFTQQCLQKNGHLINSIVFEKLFLQALGTGKMELSRPAIALELLKLEQLHCCLSEDIVNVAFLNAFIFGYRDIFLKILDSEYLRSHLCKVERFKQNFKQMFVRLSSSFSCLDLLKAFVKYDDLRKRLDADVKNIIFNNVLVQVKPYDQMQDSYDILKYFLKDKDFVDDINVQPLERAIDYLGECFDDGDDDIKRSIGFLPKYLFQEVFIAKSNSAKKAYAFHKKVLEYGSNLTKDVLKQFVQAVKKLDVEIIKALFVKKNFCLLSLLSSQSREEIITSLHKTLKEGNAEDKAKAWEILDSICKHPKDDFIKTFYSAASLKNFHFLSGRFYSRLKERVLVDQKFQAALTQQDWENVVHLLGVSVGKYINGKTLDKIFYYLVRDCRYDLVEKLLSNNDCRSKLFFSGEATREAIIQVLCNNQKGLQAFRAVMKYPELFERFSSSEKSKLCMSLGDKDGIDNDKLCIVRKILLNKALFKTIFIDGEQGATILYNIICDIYGILFHAESKEASLLLFEICRKKDVRDHVFRVMGKEKALGFCKQMLTCMPEENQNPAHVLFVNLFLTITQNYNGLIHSHNLPHDVVCKNNDDLKMIVYLLEHHLSCLQHQGNMVFAYAYDVRERVAGSIRFLCGSFKQLAQQIYVSTSNAKVKELFAHFMGYQEPLPADQEDHDGERSTFVQEGDSSSEELNKHIIEAELLKAIRGKDASQIGGIFSNYAHKISVDDSCYFFELVFGRYTSEDVINVFLDCEEIRKKLSGELFLKAFKRALEKSYLSVLEKLLAHQDVHAKFFDRVEFRPSLSRSLNGIIGEQEKKRLLRRKILLELVSYDTILNTFTLKQKNMLVKNNATANVLNKSNEKIISLCLKSKEFRDAIDNPTLDEILEHFEKVFNKKYCNKADKKKIKMIKNLISNVFCIHGDFKQRLIQCCTAQKYEKVLSFLLHCEEDVLAYVRAQKASFDVTLKTLSEKQKNILIKQCAQFKKIHKEIKNIFVACLDNDFVITDKTLHQILSYFQNSLSQNCSKRRMKFRKAAMKKILGFMCNDEILEKRIIDMCNTQEFSYVLAYFQEGYNASSSGKSSDEDGDYRLSSDQEEISEPSESSDCYEDDGYGADGQEQQQVVRTTGFEEFDPTSNYVILPEPQEAEVGAMMQRESDSTAESRMLSFDFGAQEERVEEDYRLSLKIIDDILKDDDYMHEEHDTIPFPKPLGDL